MSFEIREKREYSEWLHCQCCVAVAEITDMDRPHMETWVIPADWLGISLEPDEYGNKYHYHFCPTCKAAIVEALS